MFIIATVEKHYLTDAHLRKVILAGADALRFNFSYQTIEENLHCINIAQGVIDELHSSTKIFVDFPINKIRLGDFDLKLFPVNENDELILKSGIFTFDCYEYIPVNTPNLGEKLKIGQNITIGDGEVSMQVKEIIDNQSVKVVVQNKGVIQYMKTLNIPQEIDENEIVKTYKDIIEHIKEVEPAYIAISYFNPVLFEKIKNLIKQSKLKAKLAVKIENKLSLEQVEELCKDKDCYAILLDRGELGVNMPYYQTGTYQKIVTEIAKKYKKIIIITTQILESTINNYIPNGSEIMDLTNIIIDGVGGIMLCRETAINPRAAYTISVAKKIINAADTYLKSIKL